MPGTSQQQDDDRHAVHTAAEVARHLRVGKAAIYALINEGKLDALRIGRTIRITDAQLRAFERGQE